MSERLDRIEKILEENAIQLKKFEEENEKIRKENEKTRKENEKIRKEKEKDRKENEKTRKENEKTRKENEKDREETWKQIREVNQRFGGYQNTQSDIIEDLFFNSLNENRVLNQIYFDKIAKGRQFVIDQKRQTEIDILLYNGEYVALIEVKDRVKKKHFEQVKNHIKIYKEFYPKDNRKILFFFASFNFNDKIKEKAIQEGYGLLSLKNNIF